MPEISGRQIQDGSLEGVDIKDGSLTSADFNSSVNWKAPVATETALPTVSNITGDARVILDTAALAIWDGNVWKVFATSSYTTSSFNTDFATKTTDNLIEGTKKYFYTHNHDDLYFTKIQVTGSLATKSDVGHNHDDLYYTQNEITTYLAGKSSIFHNHDSVYSALGHDHDTRYYIQSQVNTLLSDKSDTTHNHDTTYSLTTHNHDALYLSKSGGTITGGLIITGTLTIGGVSTVGFSSGAAWPSTPKAGDECWRTDLDAFFKYNGTIWIQI